MIDNTHGACEIMLRATPRHPVDFMGAEAHHPLTAAPPHATMLT
jgi:hypothetical protein